ncbi:MAG: hypothetical protein EAZ78_03015 [Oscillatoriales cyanobacterium]|nr:MAG: hypothetical protein EAZ98_08995 [Oscillatoriales cyanobacterium]TAE05486.1 MAG: hypothetical protein EAZ96_05255 [Oscillatoriales cyanobacterium]TAF06307.1 MAG: hypothetical protein EAZ78_03015 [Oscillatoriales cyanobacterium]TAF35112.1 MAG: hypothetical protein EAZ68_18565 [Oscillatoriales cyanobacterium]TAF65647.1 MAG: hypothetical protein EAZ59_15920 [Oscillatoriales cyanobacterium]
MVLLRGCGIPVDDFELITRYQALPGNADLEALPPMFLSFVPLFLLFDEAEPLDIGSQAEPGNQLNQLIIT